MTSEKLLVLSTVYCTQPFHNPSVVPGANDHRVCQQKFGRLAEAASDIVHAGGLAWVQATYRTESGPSMVSENSDSVGLA